MAQRKTTEEYNQELIERCINAQVFEYKGSNTKVTHYCSEGHTWDAYPTNVLKQNSKGCPQCSGEVKKTHEEYEEQLLIKELEAFPLERYKGANIPIMHECLEGHRWKSRPSHILSGHKCPSCANWGFKKNEPATLYYVKISKDNQTYYKIGITNRTISERFREERDKTIEVLDTLSFSKGIDALKLEQKILKKFPRVSLKGFLRTGYSELFEEDFLCGKLNDR